MLTIISFVPGERVGVSIKKVCLRKETSKQLVVSSDELSYYIQQLLNKAPDTQSGQKEGTVEIHCSVKLICTAASDAFIFVPPYLDFQQPDFIPAGYYSFINFLEPDPPRLS